MDPQTLFDLLTPGGYPGKPHKNVPRRMAERDGFAIAQGRMLYALDRMSLRDRLRLALGIIFWPLSG